MRSAAERVHRYEFLAVVERINLEVAQIRAGKPHQLQVDQGDVIRE